MASSQPGPSNFEQTILRLETLMMDRLSSIENRLTEMDERLSTASERNYTELTVLTARVDQFEARRAIGPDESETLPIIQQEGPEEQSQLRPAPTPLSEPRVIYETMEDKSAASKRELALYVQGAAECYSEATFASVEEAEEKFLHDFGDWTEEDFQLVKPHLSVLRNTLVELGLEIRKEARLKMSIALVGYLATLKKKKHTSSRDSSRTRVPLQTSADSNTFKAAGKSFQRGSGELFDRLLPKPTDVSKAIPDASRYAGKSDEPFRSKYQVFLPACMITGL
jgi:hypothetical protein